MGADNWAECPRCRAKADAEKARKLAAVAHGYGKLPPEQWIEMKAEAEKEIKTRVSLREDYQIGVCSDYNFVVIYSAECTEPKCGFTFKFRFEEKADLPKPRKESA